MIIKILHCKLNRVVLLSLLIVITRSISAQVDTLKIIHTSDPHVTYQLNESNPIFAKLRSHLIGSEDSLNNFMKSVPLQMDADAVIITGDLIDYYEVAADIKDGDMVGNQIEQFKSLYESCPVPLYLTLGNHDIASYWINQEDSSKMETHVYADRARAAFIRNISCFNNGTYYNKEYQVGKTNYHLFFVDNGSSLPDGMYDKTQLAWITAELEKIGNEPVVIFAHRYYSIGDINGDGIYFKKNKPTNWPKEKDCSNGMLKILNEHKNIKALVLGHGHKNVWEGINFPNGHKIYQVETSSLNKNRSNWRVIKFTKNTIIFNKAGTNEIEIEINIKQ